MPRKLLVQKRAVKLVVLFREDQGVGGVLSAGRRQEGSCRPIKAAMKSALCGLVLVVAGCAGSGAEARPVDPFQARIANCVAAARPQSDAAQANMIGIPAGIATLGSSEAERVQARADHGAGGQPLFGDEEPQRQARLAAFRIDATPVTNEAYAEFVEACGMLVPTAELIPETRWQALQAQFGLVADYSHVQHFLWDDRKPRRSRERHPVVLITQDEAAFYCAWRGGRLPTAQEWERAARGPGGYIYPWGNRYDPFRVLSRVREAVDTAEVGSLPAGATPEGVLDMGGHVFEWTATPVAGRSGSVIVKGNGFGLPGGYGRGAARLPRAVEIRDIRLGFRCAADP